MIIGAVVAFLVIFGLFLSMLSGSPRSPQEETWSLDVDSGKELLAQNEPASIDDGVPAEA